MRARIDALLDPGSFHEIGALTGRATYDESGALVDLTPANFVTGRGRIDGRPVVVGGDDFTVRGGAADASIFQKQVHAERMARELRIPIVRLVDGSGGGGSVRSLETDRRSFVPFNPGWEHVVANLATVPVVSLCLGSVAGLGAARVVTSHYSVMVRGTSQLFVAGPPVVARLGEDVDKEALGGSAIHTRNGAVDDEAAERAGRVRTRPPLPVVPAVVRRRRAAARRPATTTAGVARTRWRRRSRATGARSTRSAEIIEAVFDRGSFFEIGRYNGRSAVTGSRASTGGRSRCSRTIRTSTAGGWTAAASQKVTRFVDLAQTFHLPVVHLVDNPGFVIGTKRRAGGDDPSRGARALAAIYQATVPWCSVILRKVYGVAGAAHQNASRLSYRFAWPSGNWGSLPLEGGIEAAYRAQLEAADDPDALRAEIEAQARRAPVAVPHGRGVHDRGDRRPPRHPAAAVRVREPGGAAAPARAERPRHAALKRPAPAAGARPRDALDAAVRTADARPCALSGQGFAAALGARRGASASWAARSPGSPRSPTASGQTTSRLVTRLDQVENLAAAQGQIGSEITLLRQRRRVRGGAGRLRGRRRSRPRRLAESDVRDSLLGALRTTDAEGAAVLDRLVASGVEVDRSAARGARPAAGGARSRGSPIVELTIDETPYEDAWAWAQRASERGAHRRRPRGRPPANASPSAARGGATPGFVGVTAGGARHARRDVVRVRPLDDRRGAQGAAGSGRRSSGAPSS
ncbi:MAG: hypothetical protein KatS3mg009_1684 [Acidimicrobiia bacterium]|nr:MAG: hypothetical protein KatS3mg009_1684 [Acidimicrobiia bacterium]